MAARYGAVLAIEPHAGGDFETPEKGVWLIERAAHEHLRLNFDYSHFLVEGFGLKHSADLNVPLAAHNHVKDGYRNEEGRVVYLLPGDGGLDLEEYVRVVKAAGWDRLHLSRGHRPDLVEGGVRSLGGGAVLFRRPRPCGLRR